MAPNVVVAPAQYVPYQPMAHNISDASAFPSLGSAAPVVTKAPAAAWGPGTQVVYSGQGAAPVVTVAYPQLQEQNRQGVVFDSSRPRNAFAKKPHVSGQSGEVVAASPPATIDWSQVGGLVGKQVLGVDPVPVEDNEL